jgi:toxin HigB-1
MSDGVEICITSRKYHFSFNVMCYILPMIQSFANKATEALFEGVYVRSLPHSIQAAAHRKLLMIDAAVSVNDLLLPPGNRLEALHGERSGQFSIRINGQWRICFYFVEDKACAVEVADYH